MPYINELNTGGPQQRQVTKCLIQTKRKSTPVLNLELHSEPLPT